MDKYNSLSKVSHETVYNFVSHETGLYGLVMIYTGICF